MGNGLRRSALIAGILFCCSALSPGARRSGTASLPYLTEDGRGGQWRVYQNGQIQQTGGDRPVYALGAALMIGGRPPLNATSNQARIVDAKTGEIAVEGLKYPGFDVTRRILINKETNVVRYIDIVKNTQATDQTVDLSIQSRFYYGFGSGANVPDPKRNGQDIGWVGQTGAIVVAEVFAGKNTKQAMRIGWQNGSNVVSGSIQLTIHPGRELAVLHLHCTQPSRDAAVNCVKNLKEADILKSVPRDIRRLIVNFPSTRGIIGDVEILRGDLLDVIELKSGDQLKGTLKEPTYDLTTFYGPVSLPVDRVIALLNVGQFRPRQLIITTDGQIFGGTLKKQTLSMELSSGQVTQAPLSQVARAGYRKRKDEPEEWTFDKPIVLLRSGERMAVKLPTAPLECQTRYGKLSLTPGQIASVILQSEDSTVHEFRLTDGSRFTGLLSADAFDMKLDAPPGSAEQAVRFPVSAIARMQFSPRFPEPDDNTATIRLTNDDTLVGTITGKLKIDTSFDTITVNAGEIRSLTHANQSAADVQAVLSDGSSVSGQLQELELPCQLAGGMQLRVPAALLEEYNQPRPEPSRQIQERIVAAVADLSSEDWKKRDRAQAALIGMEPVAIGPMRKLREDQPPQAQKLLTEIINTLEKQTTSTDTEEPKQDKAPAPAGGSHNVDLGNRPQDGAEADPSPEIVQMLAKRRAQEAVVREAAARVRAAAEEAARRRAEAIREQTEHAKPATTQPR